MERVWSLRRSYKPEIAESPWLPSGNLIIKRTAFDEVGGFDESLITCEDLDLSSKLWSKGWKLVFVKKAAVIHTGESKTLLAFFKKRALERQEQPIQVGVGRSNVRSLPSIILPLVQLVILVSIPLLFLFGQILLGGIMVLASFGLPFLRALLISYRIRSLRYFLQLVVIWHTYYAARAIASVNSI